MRYNPFKHACFLSILCEMYAGLSLFKHAYMYWYVLLVSWTSVKHDYICYEWSWNCNVIMVSWIGIWYGFEIGYNCHNICIHGNGIEFRGEKICMVNFITTWYATTRCTVDGSGTCQGPFFYAFLCQGLHGSYGTCDNSLYLLFKEGSHSPCLSSIPLAGYISSMVSLRQSS